MPYIYQPKGRAGEYGELVLNIYKGCSHGCKYCYVPAILFQSPDQFHANPQARTLNQKQLSRELESHQGESIFICFTCDPYQPEDLRTRGTRIMIQQFMDHGISPIILTKGGSRSTRAFDLLTQIPFARYGATLTFLDPAQSLEWEPGAATPRERIETLKQAHATGIRTWASLEPVIDPAQSLEIIRRTKDFVDQYKIGRWNHDARADRIDWKNFGEKAIEICRAFGKKYYIKKDLAKFLQ